ncbi:MAG: hypothetical protein ACK4GQ_01600 [Candidatus Hadarchaeales archaeon]
MKIMVFEWVTGATTNSAGSTAPASREAGKKEVHRLPVGAISWWWDGKAYR